MAFIASAQQARANCSWLTNVSITTNNPTDCLSSGQSVVLVANPGPTVSASNPDLEYWWYKSGNPNPINIASGAAGRNFTVVGAYGSGSYYVRARYTVSCGFVGSNFINVQYSNSQVSFTLNGSASTNVTVCQNSNITIDGSASTCDDNYFVSVQETNAAGTARIGNERMQWYSGAAPSNIDVRAHCLNSTSGSPALTLQAGKYYRVKLAVGPEWSERTVVMYLEPASASSLLNGSSNYYMNICNSGNVTMDISGTSCAWGVKVIMREVDNFNNPVNAGVYSKVYRTAPYPNTIDIKALWSQINGGFAMLPNRHYRIKIEAMNSKTIVGDAITRYFFLNGACRTSSGELSNDEALSNFSLKAYPNPSKGKFTLQAPNQMAFEGTITDLSGRVVKRFNAEPGQAVELNLRKHGKGIYLLKATSKEGTYASRLVVQ